MYDDWTTRNRDLRPTVAATLTRPPGRRRDWTAEAGRWLATGATEKAAADALTASVSAFMAEYRPPTVITYAGHVAITSLDTDADGALLWRVQNIRPDGGGMTTGHSAKNWSAAEAYARYVLAYDATDWHDDASVHAGAAFLASDERCTSGYGPAELLKYAAWQRAARHAINTGVADYHAWASEHEREFTVPPAVAA